MGNQNPEGMILGGRYRIQRLIGSGGMANVYLAVDLTNGLNVAIKILKMEYSADEEFIHRFDMEARAVASLTHPNIVRVYGVGQEGQFRYMVQEYVDGITVKELIRQNGYIDWRIAVPIVIQVCMALSHAHENGIVHRDVKPHNIIVTRDRIAKVTDFGIARAATSNTITFTSGGAMGSVHYFSPEQARGAIVGPSSDIYSTGILLFEMLTGRVPFDGDTPVAIAVKHLQDAPPYASQFVGNIPRGLDAILQKCMQKSPEQRYSTIRELVMELDAFMVDPAGTFGVVNRDVRMEDATVQVQGLRQEPNYGKLNEIERSIERRRRSRIADNAMVIVLVCVILAVVGVTIWLLVNLFNKEPAPVVEKDFTVENYVGKNYIEVTNGFAEQDFRAFKLTFEPNADFDPNIIFEQSIAPGVVIRANGTIEQLELKVSVPPNTVAVPGVVGLRAEDARKILESKGFSVAEFVEVNENMEEGIVIRTEPGPDIPVEPKSIIQIFVSKLPEKTTTFVPAMQSYPYSVVKQRAEENELTLKVFLINPDVNEHLSEEDWVVLRIRSNHVPGTEVEKKTVIEIEVGSAADWENIINPTTTTEETTTEETTTEETTEATTKATDTTPVETPPPSP